MEAGRPRRRRRGRAGRGNRPRQAHQLASESTVVAGIARMMEESRCKVGAEVGVEALEDGGSGQLSPIYDRRNKNKKRIRQSSDRRSKKENQSTDWKKKT